MNGIKSRDGVRYEAYSEKVGDDVPTLNVCAELGSITIKTHSLPRIDVEAYLREVDVHVWQEAGCVYVQAENHPESQGHGSTRREAEIIITAPADCPTFVQVVTGAVSIQDVEAVTRTHVITGNTTLNNLQGPIFASTVTGSINYRGQLVNGTHRFMATTGSLRIDLQDTPNARIYAWATTGSVRCDLALSEQRRGGYLTGDHLYGVAGTGEGRVLAEVVTGSVRLGIIAPATAEDKYEVDDRALVGSAII